MRLQDAHVVVVGLHSPRPLYHVGKSLYSFPVLLPIFPQVSALSCRLATTGHAHGAVDVSSAVQHRWVTTQSIIQRHGGSVELVLGCSLLLGSHFTR